MKFAPRLKGSNLYINEDVSKATHEIRKLKMHELKEKRKQGLIAYFSGIQLIVKKRTIDSNDSMEDSKDNRTKGKRNQACYTSVPCSNFVSLMYSNNLIPTILRPTRVGKTSATLIDHIWTTSSFGNSFNVCESGNFLSNITEHIVFLMYLV